MQKWKKILSGVLAGVMIFECGLTTGSMQAHAAEQAAPGTVYDVYKAYQDGSEIAEAWVDPEFGTTYPVTLNSSISPRAIQLQYQNNQADNGKMLATFECNRLPKTDAALVAAKQGNGDNINENLSSFPVYESLDGGKTWGAGDTEMPARGGNYLPVGYVQDQGSTSGTTGMRNCPQLYEMPETIGSLQKGTILCAGNSIEAGTNGAAADASQSKKTNLDLCISTDLGRNWNYHSTIVGPTEGLCVLYENTVWEPFFLTHDGKLYCFYSDEAFDNTKDQDISYVYYDGQKWSEKHRIIYSKGQRPGMPVVSQWKDGRFMLTYEIEGGGGLGSGYILSAPNDPTKWYDKEGNLKDTTKGEFVPHNAAKVVNKSGAPYNITTDKDTVLYNNTALGQIWASSSVSPDDGNAFWRYYHTGLASAYNRQILQLDNGNIFVIGGYANSGIKCVSLDYEMDLEKTGYIQSKVPFNGDPVYLAYNNSPLFTWTGKDGHAEENQYYEFQEIDTGVYVLVSTNNGKAVAPASASVGSEINTETKNDADTRQHWLFEEGSDGYYRIKNVASNLYLTSPRTSASDARDKKLTLQEKQESDSQLWKADIKVNLAEDETGKTKYNVQVKAAEGVEVTAAKTVTEGKNLNLRVTKKEGCKSIDKITVNNVEQQFTVSGNGVVNLKVENVQSDLSIVVEATLADWFVSVPSNDHHGRNQCLSPRVVEALDGKLYCTFESAIASEEAGGEFVFPIYESEDKGKTWKKVGEIVNDDTVHPDEWYQVTYNDKGVPTEGKQVSKDTEGAIRHPWSMHNCPQLFVLPQDLGSLKKGTLLCAGDAVTIEENPQKVSDAGYGGLWKTSLDLYYSTDKGRSWTYLNTIADGGRNIMGYTPVWEPFFLFHDDQLICYYSDETDRPAHAQKLVHKIMKDGKTWGTAVDDVAFDNKNARPGMPIVTQMENGKWMMVYEGVGTSSPIASFCKIADDPYNWNPKDPGTRLPLSNGKDSGSPYVYTLKDGRVIASTGTHPEVLINTKKDGTGAWLTYEVGAIGGYNRCYLQLSTGELLINGSKGFDQKDNYIYIKSVDVEKDLKEKEELKSLYYITSKVKEEVLGIDGGSTANGAKAMTWTNERNSENQMWIPVDMGDGTYTLKNFASGKLLAVKEDGTLVQLNETKEDGDAQKRQRWAAVKKEEGFFTLQNQSTNQYLGAGDNHTLTLANTAGEEQAWAFAALGDSTKEFGADQQEDPVKYTITYHLDGGTNDAANPAEYDATQTITLKDPTREGYTFEGWYSDNAFQNKVTTIAAGTTGNLDFYAKWKKNGVTPPPADDVKVTKIKLNATSKKLLRGKTYTLKKTITPSNATNKAVTFKSSNTKIVKVTSKGVVKALKPGVATVTVTAKDGSKVKASCKFTVPYKITYKLNKGTNHKGNPSTYYNQKITLKKPVRKGYTFSGWYSDKKFKKKVTVIAKSSKKDLTLYAKWKKVTVKKASIKKITNVSKQKAKITINKVSGAKGYKIQYSTDKKFKKGVKSITTKTATKTIAKLKKKKTYYMRACAYKLDSKGSKVYGSYSKVKAVKIKK